MENLHLEGNNQQKGLSRKPSSRQKINLLHCRDAEFSWGIKICLGEGTEGNNEIKCQEREAGRDCPWNKQKILNPVQKTSINVSKRNLKYHVI